MRSCISSGIWPRARQQAKPDIANGGRQIDGLEESSTRGHERVFPLSLPRGCKSEGSRSRKLRHAPIRCFNRYFAACKRVLYFLNKEMLFLRCNSRFKSLSITTPLVLICGSSHTSFFRLFNYKGKVPAGEKTLSFSLKN